jgi:intracellular sulfur oxidation DsrE/DsrF family protein
MSLRISGGRRLAALAGLCWLMTAVSAQAEPYYADQKVVYHNDGSPVENARYFGRLLGNLHNHIAAVGRGHIEVRVVDLGDGVDLLQLANNDPGVAAQVDALRADGVVFLICNNTLLGRKIDWHTLYGVKAEDIVPSGVAELVRLEQRGYAYVHP